MLQKKNVDLNNCSRPTFSIFPTKPHGAWSNPRHVRDLVALSIEAPGCSLLVATEPTERLGRLDAQVGCAEEALARLGREEGLPLLAVAVQAVGGWFWSGNLQRFVDFLGTL